MSTVLIVIHLIIVLALCGLVLIQKSEGGGLGLGGGSSGPAGLFTGRGQANLLTRSTAILGTAFFVTSLLLSILAAQNTSPRSIIDQVAPGSTQPSAPTQNQPAPALPAPGSGGTLLDQLQGQSGGTAPTAPTPAAPAQ
jgi:preprotein translocase subunit SecG